MTRPRWGRVLTTGVILTGLMSSGTLSAQDGGWTHWGADERSTRYTPLDQIDGENFEDLEVAWVWRGDNYGPTVDSVMRSTPIYAEGKLFGVAGYRRTVVAIEPATGETLWTFREPSTKRWENSQPQELREGRRLRRGERRRTNLCSHAGVLPARARSGYRCAHRQLRRRGDRRPAGRPRLRVPSGGGSAVDAGLHHEFLAADRRQRRRDRR